MEWIPILFSALAAAVSVLGAIRSHQEAERATAVQRARATGRGALGAVMDTGNAHFEEMRGVRSQGGIVEEHVDLMERYQRWEDSAHLAVGAADQAQLARLDLPLKVRDPIHVFEERLQRLQEIQDRM